MSAISITDLCVTLRKAVGKRKQQDVAKALSVTPQYVCDILEGRRKLSAYIAVQLKDVLGVDGRKLYLRQAERELESAAEDVMLPEN